jgi:hypothetical protein
VGMSLARHFMNELRFRKTLFCRYERNCKCIRYYKKKVLNENIDFRNFFFPNKINMLYPWKRIKHRFPLHTGIFSYRVTVSRKLDKKNNCTIQFLRDYSLRLHGITCFLYWYKKFIMHIYDFLNTTCTSNDDGCYQFI